jgi:hypothetical protein
MSETFAHPYNNLKREECFSYSSKEKQTLKSLKKVIKDNEAITVLEMGAWNGKETYQIAKCLPYHGRVYAYDNWVVDHKENPALKKIYPHLFDHFVSNLMHKKQIHKVIAIPRNYNEAIYLLYRQEETMDVIYINLSHNQSYLVNSRAYAYDLLQDVYMLVDEDGVICGSSYNQFKNEIDTFADEYYLDIHVKGDFWELGNMDNFVRCN